MVFILGLSACGKKANESSPTSNQKLFPQTSNEKSLEVDKNIKEAVRRNKLSDLEYIVSQNPSVNLNQLCADGETLLTVAIKWDFREVRDFLIDQGANLEVANLNEETPLIVAVTSNQMNSVQVLLDKRVDLNKKDRNDDTALHRALKSQGQHPLNSSIRKGFEEIALLLIRKGANIEITNINDKNAFKLAQENQVASVVELIKSIMEVNYGNPDVLTFITLLTNGDSKNLSLMLSRYPSMAIEHASVNPLVLAMDLPNELDALKNIQILLNYHVDVNGPENAGITPLIKAVKLQNRGFVQMMLERNVDVNARDSEDKSALFHAIDLNNSELVELLVIQGAEDKNCNHARTVQKRNLDQLGKDANKSIRKILKCRAW